MDGKGAFPPNTDLAASLNNLAGSTRGIEVTTEFKPVEHPLEPLDNDQSIQCPLSEPSILYV
ncbi:unnamed protein product [Eruca vesicaria subsp. sativa]|uniref:Uncharacterized protein n=1 Tax=Eruca vesicaria subsp. sativa TaxID=29727 RepID=A0ABC8LLB0_ERUVS|nr:unnamed protein product [Eruca vesicaria subsp. sativa]